jgi:predicted DNA-binding transcriptional regulator AlpA
MSTRQIVERLLSIKQVCQIVGLSKTHIARLEKAGKFVLRVRLTDHPRGRCGWPETEIYAWVADRIALRDKQPR